MFKNYFKLAFRNLWKNKSFSAINIIGLATGLAVCLLIVLYVIDELSYDRYNAKADRIYRLDADIFFNGTLFTASTSPEPLPATLKREYPQVEEMVRLSYRSDILVKKGNENIRDNNAVFADSTIFKIFTLPMVAGNPATALREPNSIVIDETTAKKYFNTTQVIGKTMIIDNATHCKITGVIKDIPRQSHFHFHFIRPLMDTHRGNEEYWLSNNVQSYILAKPGVSIHDIQSKVDATVNKYLGAQLQAELKTSMNDLQQKGNYFKYPLMPLLDIHLHSEKSYEFEANGNITYVYIFSIIAILILALACVNFMNLSTARSANRAREVGIRKVAGSMRNHLIIQFLMESIFVSLAALVIALLAATLLIPYFNQLSGKEMEASAIWKSWMLPLSVGLAIVTGCLAGSYPAFYLSAFRPIQVLKGRIATGFKGSRLRSGLVVFQFCISIILIIGTIVIYNQLKYIQDKKIGYNREQILVLHNAYNLDQQIFSFRDELSKLPGVENVSISSNLPVTSSFDQSAWFHEATMDANRAVITTNFYVDENYIPTLGMEILQGRDFSKDHRSDSNAIILNEEAVKILGFKDPLNQIIYSGSGSGPAGYHVVGVVKDFNFSSMRNRIGPLVLQLADARSTIAVRLNSNDLPASIKAIEATWKEMAPAQPFNYTFLDDDFNNVYQAEQRTGKLFISFAVFAIFIACLGLFGLVTYAAEQRTKEISIRKVLGAGVQNIITLLSKDFAKLVLIASLIAFPVAWYAMHQWLQSFAYRTNIGWEIFIIAGAIAIIIALITIGFQAVKAAIANPVTSLRNE